MPPLFTFASLSARYYFIPSSENAIRISYPMKAAGNHSPLFFADEAALPVGVRTMAGLALDYLAGSQSKTPVGPR